MRIAVDAMGGDRAPGEIIRGAKEAARSGIAEVILVGREDVIMNELRRYPPVRGVSVVHAEEVIEMEEQPASALRKKTDSSISVATRLVKEGIADALVSAGNTGAQMAAALLGLGRISGVQRPAIGAVIPTFKSGKLLLDAGANVDCKPHNLLQFAKMGSFYAQKIMEIPCPKVGLLNIGTEACKGNEVTLETYELLKESKLNFVGNVEARDIFQGEIDVIVCDGFVGNAVLKFGEGMVSTLFQLLDNETKSSWRLKLGAALVAPALKKIKRTMDYAEYGGAPLLGVQGVSIISHGSSDARAIKNAVKLAVYCVEKNFVLRIKEFVA